MLNTMATAEELGLDSYTVNTSRYVTSGLQTTHCFCLAEGVGKIPSSAWLRKRKQQHVKYFSAVT